MFTGSRSNFLNYWHSGGLCQIRVRLLVQHHLRGDIGNVAERILYLQFCLFGIDSHSFHVSIFRSSSVCWQIYHQQINA